MKDEHDAVGASVAAAEKNVEPKIERIIQADLVAVPYAAALCWRRLCKRVAIAGILLGGTI